LATEGFDGMSMHHVYILQSIAAPDQFYTGLTDDLDRRIKEHNRGASPHSAKFAPWKLLSCHSFADRSTAARFETYLKSGSGRAFARRHLR
jgi:putative endonuclease